MDVDKVGVDEMGVDEMGNNRRLTVKRRGLNVWARHNRKVLVNSSDDLRLSRVKMTVSTITLLLNDS